MCRKNRNKAEVARVISVAVSSKNPNSLIFALDLTNFCLIFATDLTNFLLNFNSFLHHNLFAYGRKSQNLNDPTYK